jgi:glycine/D-amino acid oxidase-like deaminating enzyme
MFSSMNVPIAQAPRGQCALFADDLIEDVFLCKEHAFDWSVLRGLLEPKLAARGVTLRMGETVERIEAGAERARLHFADGRSAAAPIVFNATYANINAVLLKSGLKPLELKHELAEMALVEPPTDFANLAVTVMDGPFFSAMPYPSERLYSLSHVRYTPHFSWVDRPDGRSPYDVAKSLPHDSRWRHMMLDAQRYIPSFADMRYVKSIFDVKTVLVKNERDDGRPILLHQHKDAPSVISVMGAKIDNIYDLFEALPAVDARWRSASDRRLFA